jgi:hypothetical protein
MTRSIEDPSTQLDRLTIRAFQTDDLNDVIRLSRFYAGLGYRLDEVVCYGKRLEVDEP